MHEHATNLARNPDRRDGPRRDGFVQGDDFVRRVLDSLFVFVGVLGTDGTLIGANRAPLEAAGIDIDDVVGKKFWDCVWWSYSPEWQARLKEAIAQANRGEAVRYDALVRMANDSRMWIDFQLAPLRDEGGRITHLIPSAIDLTERKRVEQEAASERRLLDAVLDALPVGVLIADANGKIVRSNPANDRLWGATPGTNHWKEYGNWVGYWPDTGARIKPEEWAMTRALLEGEVVTGELVEIEQFVTGTRRLFVNTAAPVRDERGNIVAGVVAELDVTERVEAERAQRESDARFRALADNIAQLAWMADAEGNLFWYNQRWFDYTGTTLEEMRGWGWQRVHHPDYLEAVTEKFKRHLASGAEWEDTFPLRGRDGQYRWFLSRAAPIRDEQGRITRWFGTNTDITERRAAEEELARHRTRLQDLVRQQTAEIERTHEALRLSERMGAMGTLSAGLGHDLGNILVPMRLWLDELERAELSPDAREKIARLRESAEYLKSLASGLRSVSLDPEDESAAPASTKLEEWWPEVRGVYRAPLPRGVELHAGLFAGLPAVAIPRHTLTQVVFNLIQNAADVLRDRPKGNIWIEAERAEGFVRVKVRDDGPGMAPEVRARCVEPFFTTKKRGRGTGLGLSIVHNALRRCGGSLGIESEPGAGTTFVLTFPVAAPAAAGRRVAVSVADPRLGAVMRAVSSGMGFDVLPPGPAAGADVWIADRSVSDPDLRAFIAGGGRVIALDARPGVTTGVRVLADVKMQSIRAALAGVTRAKA